MWPSMIPIFAGGVSAPVGPSSLLNDELAYFTLDEASGNRVDESATYTLTDVNTVGSTTGKLGNAASFDGQNLENLSIDNAAFDMASTAWAVSLWLKTTAVSVPVFTKDGAYKLAIDASGLLVFSWRNTADSAWYTVGTTAVDDDAWHHVVCDFNGTDEIRIIVDDGTPETAATNAGRDSTNALLIGG